VSSAASCEHVFVTSDGSAYARFHRALDTGNLAIIRAAAAELPRVELDDALRVCWAVREQPTVYERAVVRWIGRFCLEGASTTLDDVEVALAAFEDLPLHGRPALTRLQRLCGGGRSSTSRSR
jgi:hypothetical protein